MNGAPNHVIIAALHDSVHCLSDTSTHFMLALVKFTRSTTAFVISAFSKFVPTAYALVSTASCITQQNAPHIAQILQRRALRCDG